jgi:MFS family permease
MLFGYELIDKEEPELNTKTYLQLSVMMFIEFFIWGAWFVTVGNYMSSVGMTEVIYWAYTVGPIGAIISPFFLGMIADRFFPTERVLGVLHIIGGIAIFLTPFAAEGEFASAPLFIILLLIHNLCYMPTIGLVNSLAFHHIGILGADETAIPLRVAAIASFVMGLYSFTLPHTPPPAAGEEASVRKILGLDALSKLKSRPFVVFIVSSFLICIPLAVYYAYAPVFVNALEISNPAFKMSFGQMSEVVFIVLMPFFFALLGVKWMLFVGMLAWVIRYILFSLAAPTSIFWMVFLGIILHGICYDFFFIAGQIYVDKKSTAKIRGQAQGFLVLVTYGFGMLIGAQISGKVFNTVVNGSGAEVFNQWQFFWMLPAIFAGIVLIFFTFMFNEKKLSKAT